MLFSLLALTALAALALWSWRCIELERGLGQRIYSFDASSEVQAGDFWPGRQLVLLDSKGMLSCLDASGKLKWSCSTPFSADMNPQLLLSPDGRAYLAGGALRVSCFDSSGDVLWETALDSSWQRTPQPPEQGAPAELVINDGWDRMLGLDTDGQVCWSREAMHDCNGSDIHLTAGQPFVACNTVDLEHYAVQLVSPGGLIIQTLDAPGNTFGGWTRDDKGNFYLVACEVAGKCGLVTDAWMLSYKPDGALRWKQGFELSDEGAFLQNAAPLFVPGQDLIYAARDGGGLLGISSSGRLRLEHLETAYLAEVRQLTANELVYCSYLMRPPGSLSGPWSRLSSPWTVTLNSEGSARARSLVGRSLLTVATDGSGRVVLRRGRRIECRQW